MVEEARVSVSIERRNETEVAIELSSQDVGPLRLQPFVQSIAASAVTVYAGAAAY